MQNMIVLSVVLLMWVVPFVWNWRTISRGLQARREIDMRIALDSRGNSERGLLELIDEYPQYSLPSVRWAATKLGANTWVEALQRSEVVIAKFPREASGYVIKLKAFVGLEQIDEADRLGADILLKFPTDVEANIEHAWIAHRMSNWAEADRRWARVRQHAPSLPQGYVQGFEAQVRLGNLTAAESLCLMGIDLVSPSFLKQVSTSYAQSAHQRGDWARAAERWQLVRSRVDYDPIGYWKASEALRKLGRRDDALAIILDALVLFPTNEDVLREVTELQMGLQGDALAHATK